MTPFADLMARAASRLLQARHVVALTGAGVSTPSGIPDFRSARSGLWEQHDPFEVASLTAFRYQPEKFYAWLRPLARQIYDAHPNPAHWALAALESRGLLKTVITQNIDALHRRAGSRHLLEIHGSLHEAVCGQCHQRWPGGPILEQFVLDGVVPKCSVCGGVLKPDVILMGEALPEQVLRAAFDAAQACDVMLVVGTSLEVLPAGRLPYEAVVTGASLIIINRESTYMDERAEVVLFGDAAEILPQLSALVAAQIPSYA